MKDLKDKIAVITGAASGIGLALTERCIAEGMKVVMADIEAPKLEAESARLTAAGGDVTPFVCDVSDADQVEALKVAALAAYGAVHLLVNNAGVASGKTHINATPGDLDWVIGVNVLGVSYGVAAFARMMIEQGEGYIVNTASEAGLIATPFLGSYHTSKYAVVGLSEGLAMELEGTGVGVSCLCPELINTKIFESARNAPASAGLPVPGDIPISFAEQMMGTTAMDAADAAADIIYAVKANRFWIITHQVTLERMAKRNEDLERGRRPRNPQAH
jgi:NAD(P)-dependent dehydrogenase (short-subunit alcohol dehydrogenase family)